MGCFLRSRKRIHGPNQSPELKFSVAVRNPEVGFSVTRIFLQAVFEMSDGRPKTGLCLLVPKCPADQILIKRVDVTGAGSWNLNGCSASDRKPKRLGHRPCNLLLNNKNI